MRYDSCLKHIELRLDEIDLEFQSADQEKRRKLSSEAKFLDAAKDAIKKQVPIKPKLVFGEKTNTHRYGRLISCHCPSCGRFILALYETDLERGGGISDDLRGCSKCLQAIDFTGYYHKSEENEEVIFDD